MTQSLHVTSPPQLPANNNNILSNKPSLTFQNCLSQPPKPPERSCSFKDVDNLQQQSEAAGCMDAATNASGVKSPNQIQQSKRQRSLTNKDSSNFCLKDLPTNLSTISSNELEQQPVQKVSNVRPKSRLFMNNANFLENLEENLQSTTIKITSMKLNDTNTNSSQHASLIDQASFNGSNLVHANGAGNKIQANFNFNKFGTMPSSNKLAAKHSASNSVAKGDEKQNNDTKKSDAIPEFQRVFGHLRKVTKTNNNETTNSIGNLDKKLLLVGFKCLCICFGYLIKVYT